MDNEQLTECGGPQFDPLRDKPLTVQYVNGTLMIEAGVNVVVDLFDGTPIFDQQGKITHRMNVTNREDFMYGVVSSLLKEDDLSGVDRVREMLDDACWEAGRNGCGVETVEA